MMDFAERGALLTEAVEVRGIWTTEEFRFEGRHFAALAQSAWPRPVQCPHVPLWLGGNSVVVRRRVARDGQGWTPLINDETTAATTRTAIIDTPAATEPR
jgi:alkanesulfonate monooxygenase SsuD/methylene tetrahydromethanopterin reductase-like flavin-dependent oxidoreductase (luciferase family)